MTCESNCTWSLTVARPDGYTVEHCTRCGKPRESWVEISRPVYHPPALNLRPGDRQDPRAAAILGHEPY